MTARALRALAHRRAPWLAAALAMALSLPSLAKGFLVDDWVHRAMFLRRPGVWSGSANMFAFAPDLSPTTQDLAFPWWAAPDLELSFFRPLSGFTHYLDYQLWPDSPWLMHLHSVAWYGAAVLATGMMFQRLMGAGWIAGLAALIYGISYTHAVPVMFIANRNALVGVTFSALALMLHHAWRATGNTRAALAAPAALLLGLFGNEGAVATLGYLFAYAWLIDRAPLRLRVVSLVPATVVIALWRVVYSSLGHGAWGSEAYLDPLASPLRFIQAAIVRAPILLNAQWLLPPADFWAAVPWLEQRWAAAAAIVLVGLAAVLWPLLRRDAPSRFWAIGMLLSIVPACATFPMNRLLMHVGIGFAAILAQFIAFATSAECAATTTRVRRLATRITVDVLVATHLILTWVWFPGLMQIVAGSFRASTQGVEQLAQRPDLAGRIVVLVDDVLGSGAYFPAFRDLSGLPPPAQVLVLSPAIERTAPLVMTRESARTLVVEHRADYPWFLERDDLHPFSPGDRVQRDSVSVEVRSVRDGKPVIVAFHFDRALEDPSIAWFGRFEPPFALFPRAGHYPEWTPPAVGRTVAAK